MGPRCLVPLAAFAVVLAFVLSPSVAISGKKLPESPEGRLDPDQPEASAKPNSHRRFRPLVTQSKTPNDNPIFFNPLTYLSGGVYAFSVAVGDFNGDGKEDLVIANQCPQNNCSTSAVSVLLGNGDGTFQAAQSYSTGGYEAYAVTVGDVNNDGKADLIVANGCQSPNHC